MPMRELCASTRRQCNNREMMRIVAIIVVILAIIGLIVWAALRNPSSQPAAPAVGVAEGSTANVDFPTVPRIPLTEAKQEIDSGSVMVIDVRDADAYIAAHIPGARQIPLARIEGEIPYLPRNKPIITYCT